MLIVRSGLQGRNGVLALALVLAIGLVACGGGEPEAEPMAEESMAEGETEIVLGHMPYSSDGKDVLKYAMREVRDLGASEVGTEHLLLGVLSIPTGVVTQILMPLDVSLEVARAEVVALSA